VPHDSTVTTRWIADTAPSMPVPPSRPVVVDLGGFCFTTGGIAVRVTPAQVGDLVTNLSWPSPPPGA